MDQGGRLDVMSVLRRGRRSARTPPKSPIIIIGRNRTVVTSPMATVDPVSSSASQLSPTDCIQVPMSEMTWPRKSIRKLCTSSAENWRAEVFLTRLKREFCQGPMLAAVYLLLAC